jgi:DNA-binding PadR family transcriptional regulator
MPRKKSAPSSAEYAILGLLHEQPMHGYQIAQELAPDRGLGLICPLGLSNVYFLLSNLNRDGLVEVDHHQQDVYPPKTVFRVTAAGQQIFESWIRKPPGRLRDVRLDFPLKLYFLGHENAESIPRLLDDQIEFCKQYLSEWKALVKSAAPRSFDRLAMQSKVDAAQGTLNWLIECRRSLVRRRPGSRSPGRKRKARV